MLLLGMIQEIWHGDCLELLKDIPDKSVDFIRYMIVVIINLCGNVTYKNEETGGSSAPPVSD